MQKGIFWYLSQKKFIIVSVACCENGKAENKQYSAQNPKIILITKPNGQSFQNALLRDDRIIIIREGELKYMRKALKFFSIQI